MTPLLPVDLSSFEQNKFVQDYLSKMEERFKSGSDETMSIETVIELVQEIMPAAHSTTLPGGGIEMYEGRMYKFQYAQQSGNGQWYAWEVVAKFIAREISEYSDELVLSGRPLYGTSYLQVKHIYSVEEVQGAPTRPIRQRGAVPAPKG